MVHVVIKEMWKLLISDEKKKNLDVIQLYQYMNAVTLMN